MVKKTETAAQLEPVRRRAASLTDLKGEPTMVELLMPDDSVLEIPFRVLAYSEWQQVERDVPQPQPKILAGKDGVYADKNDPEYLQQLSEWRDAVLYRRVLASLDIPVEGGSIEEKLKNLHSMVSTPVMMGLVSALSSIHFAQRARVVARAEAFRPGADIDAAAAGS